MPRIPYFMYFLFNDLETLMKCLTVVIGDRRTIANALPPLGSRNVHRVNRERADSPDYAAHHFYTLNPSKPDREKLNIIGAATIVLAGLTV